MPLGRLATASRILTCDAGRHASRGSHMHDDHHDHGSEMSPMVARVRALETVLTEKGYVDPKALDLIVETYETKIGPRNGAQVVARAWADPVYKARLMKDATVAIAELGFSRGAHGRRGKHGCSAQPHRLYPLLLLSIAGLRL